jgi:hypothetical protein
MLELRDLLARRLIRMLEHLWQDHNRLAVLRQVVNSVGFYALKIHLLIF